MILQANHQVRLSGNDFKSLESFGNRGFKTFYHNIVNNNSLKKISVTLKSNSKATKREVNTINNDAIENIYYLGEAIKFGEVRGTWEEATFNLILERVKMSNINNIKDESIDITMVESREIMILGKGYPISKIIRTFKNASIKKLEKVKQKILVLEDGDTIKIIIIPSKKINLLKNLNLCYKRKIKINHSFLFCYCKPT